MQIYVKLLTGKTISIEVTTNDTVEFVKQQIEELDGFPIDRQHLVFAGKRLDSKRTLSEYNIQKECLLYLVIPFRGGCGSLNY